MYQIKSSYEVFNAKDILENGGLFEEVYHESYDEEDEFLEESCYTKEEANYLWRVLDYSVTKFEDFKDEDDCYVTVRMYRLYNNGELIDVSCGYINEEDIYEWFPSLKDDRKNDDEFLEDEEME